MVPTSPTIRIRLAKQPPLYFVAAVVLASLLPLLFQILPDTSAVTLQRLPKLVAAPATFERILDHDVPMFAVIDEPARVQAEDIEQVVILDPEPPAPEARPRAVERRTLPRSHHAPAPGLEQRAKAACAARNKTAARTAYRSLPLGDDRRRSIRRACRESGILIL